MKNAILLFFFFFTSLLTVLYASSQQIKETIQDTNQDLKIKEKSSVLYTKSQESQEEKQIVMKKFCDEVNREFDKFKWRKIICNPTRWTYDFKTSSGRPLLYQTFQDGPSDLPPTLVMCTIHGDEPSTSYLCIQLVRDIIYDRPEKYKGQNIVVAPFVNPDSFIELKVRPNKNGVDLNRNFPTSDWDTLAHKLWKEKQSSNKRRFPGEKSASEIETIFQMYLIDQFKPSKILSIHAPYGFLDYDISEKASLEEKKEIKDIAIKMGKLANNFKVIDFNVFPGSLGNYAGNEHLIATYTLELQASSSSQGYRSWLRFKDAIHYLIHYKMNDFTKKDVKN